MTHQLDTEKLAREFCDRAPDLDGHRTFDFHPAGLSAFVAAVRGLALEEAAALQGYSLDKKAPGMFKNGNGQYIRVADIRALAEGVR